MNDLTKKPAIWIFSGSNGVGKSTYVKQHLRELLSKAVAQEPGL